jgi:hypothetical protein
MDCGNPSDIILDETLENLSSTSKDLKSKLLIYWDNQIFYWFCSLLAEKRTFILMHSNGFLSYSEKNTGAWLRTTIQQFQNVRFLFSGSRQTLLSQLFSYPKR